MMVVMVVEVVMMVVVLLVVEMVVQAVDPKTGQKIEYPCVETYRFEGQRISEWRIYPLTARLLQPGS